MAPGPTRTLRIYLSALPEDMAGERTLLLERVLPELRRRARTRGIEVELTDPGAAPERWDLEARLRAIEACDIFLAFVGERYGEPLKALPYEVLPVYSWLAPSWSLLEIEIRAAALEPLPLIENQSLFYIRIPEGRVGFPAANPEEAERVDSLKENVAGLNGRVRGGRWPLLNGYPAVWSEEEGRAAGLEDLEKALQRGLEWALEKAVAEETAAARSFGSYQAMEPEPEVPEVPLSWAQPTPDLPSEPPPPLHEDVQFTVFKPRVVAPAKWYKLLVFAHLQELPPDAPPDAQDPLEEVQRQALGLLGDQRGSYLEVQKESRHAIPHEAEITFLLQIPGFDVEPPRRTLLWLEAVQSETFRIRARPDLPDGHTARGRLTVFWGSLILAEMKLAILVDSRAAALPVPPGEREVVRPFRKIFASYSHADAVIVEQCERWARTVGDRYLRDVRDIRVGEVWTARLEELIRQADVFQLFWSRKAMESQHVEREWRYALGLGRRDFVRPTYWEDPMPAAPDRGLPPSELLELQFQPLYLDAGAHPPLVPPEQVPGPDSLQDSEASPPRASVRPPASTPKVRPAFVMGVLGTVLAVLVLWIPMHWMTAPPQRPQAGPPIPTSPKGPVSPYPPEVAPEPRVKPPIPTNSPKGPVPPSPPEATPSVPPPRGWLDVARACGLGSEEIDEVRRLSDSAGKPAVRVAEALDAETAHRLFDRLAGGEEEVYLLPGADLGLCSVWSGPFASEAEAAEAASRLENASGVKAQVAEWPDLLN